MSDSKRILDFLNIKNLINPISGFIETKVELYKLQLKEEIAKALSILVLLIIFSMVGLLFVFFLSHFFSRLLNNLLGSEYYGYLIISSVYLLSGIIVYIKRKNISDLIVNMMFPEEESENDVDDEQ